MMAIDLDAIRARAEAATPGPWEAYDRDGGAARPTEITVCGSDIAGPPEAYLDRGRFGRHADAEFIAHARADIPALCDEVGRLQGIEAAVTSAYSMLSLMRYRSPESFSGGVGLPSLQDADALLSRLRAALKGAGDGTE